MGVSFIVSRFSLYIDYLASLYIDLVVALSVHSCARDWLLLVTGRLRFTYGPTTLPAFGGRLGDL